MPSSVTQFILRPFEIKHLFDFSIRLYRSSFIPMLLAVSMVQLPMRLLALPPLLSLIKVSDELMQMTTFKNQAPDETWLTQHMDLWIWLGVLLIGAMVYEVLVMPLGNLACSRLAVQALHSEPVSFSDALRFAVSRYWPTQVALATYLLPLLVVSLLMLIPVAIFAASGETAAIAGGAATALFIILFSSLITWLFWFRLFPALAGIIQAAEEPDAYGAFAQGMWYLKRAYQLTNGFFWRLLGLSILMLFAVGFVSNGIQQGLQYLVLIGQALIAQKGAQDVLTSLSQPNLAAQGISIVISSLVALLIPALMICFQTLLYYDLRIRKEGYDLKLMLSQSEAPGQPQNL